MSPHRAFRFSDLWVFSLLWALMLVTVAVWLVPPPTSRPAPQQSLEPIRYVGEERTTLGLLTMEEPSDPL